MAFTVKKVIAFRVSTFLNKVLRQTYFLRNIYEIFNIIKVQIWNAKCDFNKDYCNKFS